MSRLTSAEPTDLVALSHSQFASLVDQDLRQKVPAEVSAMLRHPSVAQRWLLTLEAMRRNVHGSIAAKRSELRAQRELLLAAIAEARHSLHHARGPEELDRLLAVVYEKRQEMHSRTATFEQWHVKSIRFGNAVEEKLPEARWAVIQSMDPGTQLGLYEHLAALKEAIRVHQDEMHPDDASEMDEVLWSSVKD